MRLAALLGLLMAGCSAPPGKPSAADSAASSAIADDDSLLAAERPRLGAWELTAVDGKALDPRHWPVHLLVGRSGGEGQSQCIPLDLNWPGMDRPLAFPKAPPPRPDWPTRPVCTRGLTPAEQRLEPLLTGAERFSSEAPDTLTVASQGGNLTFRRPAEPVLNPSGKSGGYEREMWGAWQVAALDGQAPSTPMHLLFFRTRVGLLSGCVGIGRLVQPTSAGFALLPDPGLRTTCERMTTPDEQAAERVLDGELKIVETQPRRRTLAGPAGSITLVR